MNSRNYKGVAASPGIAIEKAVVWKEKAPSKNHLPAQSAEQELQNFKSACETVLKDLDALAEKARKNLAEGSAEIFVVHRAIIEDEYSFIAPVEKMIREDGLSASAAVKKQLAMAESVMAAAQDEYMQGRASDFRDLSEQLQKALTGDKSAAPETPEEACIVVAHEFTPSMTMRMDFKYVKGLVAEVGGATSHAAIIAKSLGIPAVTGIAGATEEISSGTAVILNGSDGTVCCNADSAETARAKEAQRAYLLTCKNLETFCGKRSVTKDGKLLELCANIATAEDAKTAISCDAEGIGLFRSEFLYMDRDTLPTEDEQVASYKTVLELFGEKPVIVRTLDIGGDKPQRAIEFPKEKNPFLGFRAIRLCLKQKDIFHTQLRALLRASAFGNLRIMFPMISSMEELHQAKQALESAKQELRAENVPISENVAVGMMMEVPSAAILADKFAAEVDFFSIGTNDLTQYTVAVDRGNEAIAELYTVYHPAVLKLIANVAQAAAFHHIPCGICGEAGSDLALIPLWAGLGITELSVVPSAILSVRKALAQQDSTQCNVLAQQALNASAASEVKRILGKEDV